MKTELKSIDEFRKEIKIFVAHSEIKQRVEKFLFEKGKDIAIKGFRQGKAPLNVLMGYFGKAAEREVVEEIVGESIFEALNKHEFITVGDFDFTLDFYETNKDLNFTIKLNVFPFFDVGDFIGIEVPFSFPEKISEDEVNAKIKQMQEDFAVWEPICGDDVAMEGDQILSDLIVFPIDSDIEKRKEENFKFIVGKEIKQLPVDISFIGKKVGEEVRFSKKELKEDKENYDYEDWNIKIKSIKRKVLPEINDDFAKEVGSYKTLEELIKSIREKMEKEFEEKKQIALTESIINTINERLNISLPPNLVEIKRIELINLHTDKIKKHLFFFDKEKEASVAEEERLEIIEGIREDFIKNKKFEEEAKKELLMEVILESIAIKEKISVNEEKIMERLNEILFDVDIDNINKILLSRMKLRIKKEILQKKTMDILKRYAKIK